MASARLFGDQCPGRVEPASVVGNPYVPVVALGCDCDTDSLGTRVLPYICQCFLSDAQQVKFTAIGKFRRGRGPVGNRTVDVEARDDPGSGAEILGVDPQRIDQAPDARGWVGSEPGNGFAHFCVRDFA